MTTELSRQTPNWVTFPRALREAIPALEPCAGRVLQLENAEVGPTSSEWTGCRVGIRLTVCETGKLDGIFDVVVDLNVEAARTLADLLNSAADQAARL